MEPIKLTHQDTNLKILHYFITIMHLLSFIPMFYTYPIQFTLHLVVKLHLRYCLLVIPVVVDYVVVDAVVIIVVVVDVVSAVIVVVLGHRLIR